MGKLKAKKNRNVDVHCIFQSHSDKKRIYIPFYNQQYENTTHTTMLYIFFFISEEIGSPISSKKKMCLLLAPLQTKKKRKCVEDR